MKQLFLLLLFATAGYLLSAQALVSGVVRDAETGQALSYVQVRARSAQVGTLTNEDGVFRLRLDQADTLIFSHIGYASLLLPASMEMRIDLAPRAYELEGVLIMPVETTDLLRQAIEAIPGNYDHQSVMQQAFFRELLKENDTYVELNEAALDIYKVPSRPMRSMTTRCACSRDSTEARSVCSGRSISSRALAAHSASRAYPWCRRRWGRVFSIPSASADTPTPCAVRPSTGGARCL